MPEEFRDRVTALITIESTNLTPEQISKLVGTAWDNAHHIGDPRGHLGKTWECNVWQILVSRTSIDCRVNSAHDLIPICVKDLCERLREIANGLRNVVRSEGGEFGIHVVSAAVPGIHFDPGTLKLIADIGLSLDLDVILARPKAIAEA